MSSKGDLQMASKHLTRCSTSLVIRENTVQNHSAIAFHTHQDGCSVQSLSRVWLFVMPWTSAWQTSLFITNFQSLFTLMSIESVMPSNHLIICQHRPLLLPSIFPSIRIFSSLSVLPIRWPTYWSFSISPSNEYSELISFRMDSLQSKGLSRVFSNTTVQKHQFFSAQLSLW